MKREKYKKCNFTLCNFMDPKKMLRQYGARVRQKLCNCNTMRKKSPISAGL